MKCLAPHDESAAAGALVDHSSLYSRFEIGISLGATTGIDEADLTHITICHLEPAQVDGMICSKAVVHVFRMFTKVDIAEPEVGFRQFLFDDIGFNGDANMICLPGKIGGRVIILSVLFKC